MKILVTGASGLVGNNLVKYLVSEGYEVWHTCSPHENPTPGRCVGHAFHKIDWDVVGKVDAVMHQAAITDTLVTDRQAMMDVNCHQSMTLFQQAIDHGCRTIIYASSCAVYGDAPSPLKEDGPKNPLNVYAESKLLLDEKSGKLASSEVKVIGLRYSNVYGPGEKHKGHSASMVYRIAQQMKRGGVELFEHGEQKRDFVCVADVVQANLKCLTAKTSGVYNCGSGVARSFNEVVQAVSRVSALPATVKYIKNPYEKSYQNFTQCDMSATKRDLWHTPTYSLEKGIEYYHRSGYLL